MKNLITLILVLTTVLGYSQTDTTYCSKIQDQYLTIAVDLFTSAVDEERVKDYFTIEFESSPWLETVVSARDSSQSMALTIIVLKNTKRMYIAKPIHPLVLMEWKDSPSPSKYYLDHIQGVYDLDDTCMKLP